MRSSAGIRMPRQAIRRALERDLDADMANPRPVKSLTQVNTADAAVALGGLPVQADGQIARLPDGGYVVVWTDSSRTHNPNGSAIVGQRYDSLGNKVGGGGNIRQFSAGD